MNYPCRQFAHMRMIMFMDVPWEIQKLNYRITQGKLIYRKLVDSE
jgi:hypothetical protein